MGNEPQRITVSSLPEALAALAAREARLRCEIARQVPARFQSMVSADDVLQEVRAALLRADLASVRDWTPWVRTAIRNALLRALRHARALRRGGGRHARDLERRTSGDGLLATLARKSRTPSRQVAGAEARQAVVLALASLPEPERVALCLCHLEGLSRRQAAAQMGRTEAAVNGLLFRGLRRLQERLGEAGKFFSDAHGPLGEAH